MLDVLSTQEGCGYDFIESFAGSAVATSSMKRMFPGNRTVAMDIQYTASMNINENSGMGTLSLLGHEYLLPCTLCTPA